MRFTKMPSETELRESLDQVAALALEFGGLLMECGASARRVEEIAIQVAIGLGAELVDLRVGYASISITVARNSDALSRMRGVGALGANQDLHHSLLAAVARIQGAGLGVAEVRAELDHILHNSSRHPDWLVATAVGIACAAFGRLMGVDWTGVGPIFVAATLSQVVRRQFALHRVNVFIATLVVSFLGATLCGLGARLLGSQQVVPSMIATVLLLVPGIPSFNAQFDILEGRPTLGSARAVWVAVTLIYMTLGVWLAQGILGAGR
jgi:uncharacterized membrane protein YjjP (DUF1212 family)